MLNKTIIKLIDNTKNNDLLDGVYRKGYSHFNRVTYPNTGIVETSNIAQKDDIVMFNPIGMLPVTNGLHCIKNESVILINWKLYRKGIIVQRQTIPQISNNFHIRDQEWFYVVSSNIDIPKKSIVVAKPSTSILFNYKNKKFNFLELRNIIFYIDTDIKCPSDKMFLEKIVPDNPFEKPKELMGIKEGITYYSKSKVADITVKSQSLLVVYKDDVYAT
jgi:hypothetical protein